MKTKAQKYNLYIERAGYIAFAICLVALCAYGLLMRAMFVNAAVNDSLQKSMSDASSRLGELEFEYISLKQSVTLDKAVELGFVEPKQTVFVTDSGDSEVSINVR